MAKKRQREQPATEPATAVQPKPARARRVTQPPSLVRIRRDDLGSVVKVEHVNDRDIESFDPRVVHMRSGADIERVDLRVVPAALIKTYREAEDSFAAAAAAIENAPGPSVGLVAPSDPVDQQPEIFPG